MNDPVRILLVDDDADVRTGTARLLEKAGYIVDQVADGEAALQAIRQQRPDLVLLDRDLAGMDGLEVCRRIKQDPAYAEIAVIMVSAVYAESSHQAESLESGADGYIARPIENRELLARVQAYVRILSLTRALQSKVKELEVANAAASQSALAALNLLEDAVAARDQANAANQQLQQEIEVRKQAEARTEHLNRVLRAIRDVNQLITHEQDREALLRRACEILTSTRGYRSAWAALRGADGAAQTVAESGIGDDFAPVREALARGEWPACYRQAQERSDGIAPVHDTMQNCKTCCLAHTYRDTAALAGVLRHGERDYGALVVALPVGLADDPEEQSLFRELVGDVAYALHSMELAQKRKQAEAALRHERALLERITSASPAGIVVVNQHGQITFANAQAEKILGLTKEAITQRTYNDVAWHITDLNGGPFPDEDLPFRRVMATRQPVTDIRHAIEWPNGRRVLLSINGAPLLDASGDLEGAVFTVSDITEQLQAEAALRENQATLAAILRSTDNGILVVSPQGKVISLNPRFAEMWRIPDKLLQTGSDEALLRYVMDQLGGRAARERGALPPFVREFAGGHLPHDT
jgi:PAS domain S-box-containing protein